MASYQPCDERFASDGWTTTRDLRFVQRRLRGQQLMFCETVTRIRTNRDLVISKLRGPWDWWAYGRTVGFHRNADGTTDQTLAPLWWYVARVGCRVLPPVTLPDGERGIRLPIYLSRHFTGLATMDVIDTADDQVIVRGRFHGVENHFPIGGIELVTKVHLGIESGTLFFPFPRGTGWVGLATALEAASGGRSAAPRS